MPRFETEAKCNSEIAYSVPLEKNRTKKKIHRKNELQKLVKARVQLVKLHFPVFGRLIFARGVETANVAIFSFEFYPRILAIFRIPRNNIPIFIAVYS